LPQSGLAAETRADPEVKSLGAPLQSESKKQGARYGNALDLLLRARQEPEDGENEFNTPRLVAVRRFKVKGEDPKPSALSATPATERPFRAALNFVDADKSTTFGILPPAGLARPEEQGESLAAALQTEAEAELREEVSPAIVPVPLSTGEEPELSFSFGEAVPQPLNLAEVAVEPDAPAEEAANFGSELLPPVEQTSTILNQPPPPSTTAQLFNPQRAESLVEQVGRKYTPEEYDQLKQIAEANGVKLTGKYTNSAGAKTSGTLSFKQLRDRVIDKGIELPPNLLEPTVFSKAGRKATGIKKIDE
jgi:hypothetical protein